MDKTKNASRIGRDVHTVAQLRRVIKAAQTVRVSAAVLAVCVAVFELVHIVKDGAVS